ncbi:type II secretion system minor pseudopilin GspJ [Psychromonas sp.]|uniref:type II secretion system minor pseudopilin GspJ n=1 Tax=Psychromonas sp. TaxID=1884585 RepID=UPI0035614EFA
MPNHNSAGKKSGKGFTLLEVLVAIMIFTLLSLAAYQVLQGVLRSGEISKTHSERLTELQRAMLIIEQDFTQMVARKSRQEGRDKEDLRALTSGKEIFSSQDQGIEFNRLGWANPLGLLPRSNIVRVRYVLRDGQLQRLYFLYPDTIAGQEPETQVLLKDIEQLSFRFWDNGWKSSWSSAEKLPEGIEINFTSKHFADIRRVFLVSSGEVVE